MDTEREEFRNKLIELVRESSRMQSEKLEAWILSGKVGERPSLLESIADNILTADIAQVKHGHWCGGFFDKITGEYKECCSNCGVSSVEYDRPHCSFCGAQMDED